MIHHTSYIIAVCKEIRDYRTKSLNINNGCVQCGTVKITFYYLTFTWMSHEVPLVLHRLIPEHQVNVSLHQEFLSRQHVLQAFDLPVHELPSTAPRVDELFAHLALSSRYCAASLKTDSQTCACCFL